MKKLILISGGADGFGKATAEKLSKKYKIVILDLDAPKTAQVAKRIGCDFAVADVTDYKQLDIATSSIIKKYKKIDCLINNAGLWIEGSLETNDPARIKRVFDVNTTGTVLLTRAVLPYMKKVKRGRIINVISQAGLTAKVERSIYNASKWGVTGFTKSLAADLVGSGITVTGFYPGMMKTNLFKSAGSKREMAGAMKLPDVVRAIEFILETPDDLAIPELGIKPAWY